MSRQPIFLPLLIAFVNAINPCTLCGDGSDVTKPNYVVRIPGYPEVSCASIANLIPSLLPDETVPECSLARQVSSLCGCPVIPGSCSLCANGSMPINLHVEIEEFAGIFGGNVPSCELVDAYLRSYDPLDDICVASREEIASICGCLNIDQSSNHSDVLDDGNSTNKTHIHDLLGSNSDPSIFSKTNQIIAGINFFGAKTEYDLSILYRASLSASLLSAICCIFVIIDCFRLKRKRKNLYNQLVGTMTAFDLLYSLSVALGTLPMDTSDAFRSPGEAGNHITCKIQGIGIQWGGLTSLFLSCGLSTYYLLVVVYNTKESRLREVRKWLLGIPIFCGSVLGACSIPFIQTGMIGCQLNPPVPSVPTEILRELNLIDSFWPFLSMWVIPGYLAVFYSTTVTSFMLFKIWQVDHKAERWRSMQGMSEKNKNLERKRVVPPLTKIRHEVFWQCFQYLAAVYFTWLVYLSLTVSPDKYFTSHYELWLFVFFLSGIQGFLNCMVYFRPRLVRYWRRWRKTILQNKLKDKVTSLCIPELQSPETASLSIQVWDQIAKVEPAVDIIAAFAAVSKPPQVSMQEQEDLQDLHEEREISSQDIFPNISSQNRDDTPIENLVLDFGSSPQTINLHHSSPHIFNLHS